MNYKSKSIGFYTEIIHRKERRTKRYEKRSIELSVQILASIEVKRYKRLRRIIANTGEFTV